MQLLTQNGKLKKTSKLMGFKVVNFGLPAYKSITGRVICPMADGCIKFCYARKGAYIWGNVKPAFEKRYELSKTDSFVSAIHAEIQSKKPKFVRVHDSGDYYSREYLAKWFQIAQQNPHVNFYSYTNMIDMVKKANIPSNYDFIFSDSGKQVDLIDKSIDRHTEIFKTADELVAAGYANASENDLNATRWFNKTNKVGLIYH